MAYFREFNKMAVEQALLVLENERAARNFNEMFQWVDETSGLETAEMKAAALLGLLVGVRVGDAMRQSVSKPRTKRKAQKPARRKPRRG